MSATCSKCDHLRVDLPLLSPKRQQHIHLTTCGEKPKCWNQRCYITLRAGDQDILAATIKHCKFCRVAQYCDALCYAIDKPFHEAECQHLKRRSYYQCLKKHYLEKKEAFEKKDFFQIQRKNNDPANQKVISELEELIQDLIINENKSYKIIGNLEESMWMSCECVNALGEKFLVLKECVIKYFELALLNSDTMDKQAAAEILREFLKDYSNLSRLIRVLIGLDDISEIHHLIKFLNPDGSVIPEEEEPSLNQATLFKNLDIFYSLIEIRKAVFFERIGIESLVPNLHEAVFQNYLRQINIKLEKIISMGQKNEV